MATTSISSKGQVVIPQAIREELGITAGDSFVVQARDDVIVLRKLDELPPKALKTLEIIEKAWKEYEEGNFTRHRDAEDALKALRQWRSDYQKRSQKRT